MRGSQKTAPSGNCLCYHCRHECFKKKLLHHLVVPSDALHKLQLELGVGILSGSCGNCPNVLNSALEQHSWGASLCLQALVPDWGNRGRECHWDTCMPHAAHTQAISVHGTVGRRAEHKVGWNFVGWQNEIGRKYRSLGILIFYN